MAAQRDSVARPLSSDGGAGSIVPVRPEDKNPVLVRADSPDESRTLIARFIHNLMVALDAVHS